MCCKDSLHACGACCVAQGGARSSEPGGAGGKARDIAWTREDAARHSAMLRLIDQLQEVQRQLQVGARDGGNRKPHVRYLPWAAPGGCKRSAYA